MQPDKLLMKRCHGSHCTVYGLCSTVFYDFSVLPAPRRFSVQKTAVLLRAAMFLLLLIPGEKKRR